MFHAMAGLRWRCLGLLVFVVGGFVGMPAALVYGTEPEPKPEAAAAGDDADGPPDLQAVADAIDLRPQSIYMHMSVQLDDEQAASHREHDMTMQVLLAYDAELALRRCEGIEVDRAITSTGEQLKVREREGMPGQRGWLHAHQHAAPHWFGEGFADEDERRVMMLNIPFHYPALLADQIETLTGTVRVHVASGAVRHAVLGPFEAIHGRRVRIPNLDDGAVRLQRDADHGQLEIRMAPRLGDLLKEVKFYSADNRELRSHPLGQHVEGDRAVFYYDVHLPDDGRIALSFYSRVDDFAVPFQWRNIPLPTPPADGRGFARRVP